MSADTDMNTNTSRTLTLFPVIVVFRVLNAVFTRSYFQADEFWQSLEPAHYMAFGYGELTWEWQVGLRSYAFPLIFELVYRFCGVLVTVFNLILTFICGIGSRLVVLVLGNDLAWDISHDLAVIPTEYTLAFEYYCVLYVPKVVMALIAATGEYYTIKLIQKLYIRLYSKDENDKDEKPNIGPVTSLAAQLTLMNFFNFFFITRTFINSFEMVLTSVALYYWDWSAGQEILSQSFSKSLFFAMFACFLRPSNGAIWVLLGGFLVLNLAYGSKYKLILALVIKIISIFTVVLTINCAIDFYFYGELIFPVFRFIKFNFTSVLSEFYGTAPWHFHLAQSVPILLGYSLPLFLYALILLRTKRKLPGVLITPLTQTKIVIVANIILYSCLKHKEFRFIYPLQPLFCALSTLGLLELKNKFPNWTLIKSILGFVPVVAIVVAAVINFYNESGVIQVMKFLNLENNIDSVGFIMPCHSTPWQSYLHRNDIDNLWAISCEPPLHLLNDPEAPSKLPFYMDESDYLYDDIPGFFSKNFPALEGTQTPESAEFPHEWPEYLVVFQHLENAYLNKLLQGTDYLHYERFFNSWSHWDSRRAGDVIVYKRIPNLQEIKRKYDL